MLSPNTKSAMTPVSQPALRLRAAYWTAMETELLAAIALVAVARQVAAQKGRAL